MISHTIATRVYVLAILAILVFIPSGSWAAEMVVNGDFEAETDLFVTWPGYVGGDNPAEVPSWTGTGGRGINPINGPDDPPPAPFRDNGGNDTSVAFLQGSATLQQDISGFTVGQEYILSLDFNARNCCGDFPVAAVSVNGVEIGNSADIFPPPGSVIPAGGTNPWYHADIPFNADGTTVSLVISSAPSAAGGDATLIVDNVSIVPEPSSVALIFLGLVGMLIRLRR